MTAPEPFVMEALQGFTQNSDKWPGPRVVKIFVSSVYNEFREERRQILETVGPEIQSQYDDRHIEVEFVDMHYGSDGIDECQPSLVQHHMQEVRECHQTSKAGYFLCFIGGSAGNYRPSLPERIDNDLFAATIRKCDQLGLESSILTECYSKKDCHEMVEGCANKWFKNLHEDRTSQLESLQKVQDVLTASISALIEECPTSSNNERYRNLLCSPMERQCREALELLKSGNHPKGLIALIDRAFSEQIEAPANSSTLDKSARQRLHSLIDTLKENIPELNLIYFTYSEDDSDAETLAEMRESVLQAVSNLIDESLSTEPDQGKGRKKTVQEVFLEHITHLNICIEHSKAHKVDAADIEKLASDIIDQMIENYSSQTRHTPILIHGPNASGKTTLLTHIYSKTETIFKKPVLRIIRFSAETPRSAYSLELLRVICQQISIILKIPEGYLPKDASFDPLYINNWFQSLLRRCEEMDNEVLVLLVDNVHRINRLECDIVTGLSWLPMSLPKNVFFICTSANPLDQLQLSPPQKEKFKNSGYYTLQNVISKPENMSEDDNIEKKFDELEAMFGVTAFSKLAGYITCSEFGLTETELLELMMPTSNSDAVISLADGNFNFSTLCVAKHLMAPLLVCKCTSGRRVHSWRACAAGVRARGRYLRAQPALRRTHEQLAALFFAQFADDGEDEEDEPSEAIEPGCTADDDDALLGSTPFHSTRRAAAAFTQRHVEESWLHLLLAGDFAKLKDLTVCNFDFLLAAVQTVTISYLRCILEHVRCYILDRDVELVYGAIKKSSDILTRDPMQLGAQVIAWLRPAVAKRGVLSALVTAAMAWCDGYDKPLLVPLNGWLQPPIASTVRVLTISSTSGNTGSSARLLQLAPSGQHLVMAPLQGDPQLWHMMSNSRVHTFKGHSGMILCMAVTKESQYLLTGSEDTTVIVWDLHTLAIKLKIAEHIAPVLCVAAIVNRSLVISGGEDSGIIVASLVDGTLVTKIDHHRGPVTGVKVIQNGEILISCSQDGTVCSWATDTFTLLNTISTTNHAPVNQMELSDDSVFLVTLEDDNELHLRTFITGTDLHTLKRHKAKVKCFTLAKDCSRCVVCCADQRAHIYSMHSGVLLRVVPAAHDLQAVTITDHDDFLLLAGGNRVTIYSFHTEDSLTNFRPTRQKKLRQTQSTTSLSLLQAEQSSLIPISCLEVSADGQFAGSGCARGLVRVWQLNSHRLLATLKGHFGPINCVAFSPNNLLCVSGSEDKTVIVWILADHSAHMTFKGHTAGVNSVAVLADSRRAISSERTKALLWLIDGGTILRTYEMSTSSIAVTHNMKYAVIMDGDKCARILSPWSDCGNGRAVSHAERLTCCALTADGLSLVTGSEDCSLKVWQLDGGKLAQVLVGHTDIVTCVAVSISNKTQVVSGSWDCNLIVWDINTGSDIHLLSGHLGKVTCVKITGDGTIALSGSEDKTLIIWETKRGLALTSLQLHVPLSGIHIASDCSRLAVHLLDRGCLPIICLHNTPAVYVKMPTYSAPAKEVDELRPLAPKRPMRRLLKKEVSLDTYTWQKKYGHLTSAAMMAQVDERLKRRFSVSASMEEISKIQQEKNKDLGSQVSLGPEEAALAQSQHFDQLEALWNKISPPRRRSNKSLSKQSSLIERGPDSSDDEHTPIEDQEHMVE